jgi:hypothetical protein
VRSLAKVLTALAAGFLSTPTADAQAWLPPKGEASLSLGYGNVFVTKHFLGTSAAAGDNVETDNGHIRAQAIAVEVGYGITDRLAVSVGIPLMLTKYYGPRPHYPVKGATSGFTIDDGLYHTTFQDYTIATRYQLINGAIAVAPFFAAVIPSTDYYTIAHSSAGRHLNEFLLGASAGGRLDRLVNGSYFQIGYSYAFVERVAGIFHDRSNVALELGYFLTPTLAARFVGTGFYTHGGVVYKSSAGVPPAQWPYHDLITHASAINLGGGLSYTLTGSTEVYASYLRTVQGRGGHKIDQALSFGVGWSFSPQQIIRKVFPPKSGGATAERQ